MTPPALGKGRLQVGLYCADVLLSTDACDDGEVLRMGASGAPLDQVHSWDVDPIPAKKSELGS